LECHLGLSIGGLGARACPATASPETWRGRRESRPACPVLIIPATVNKIRHCDDGPFFAEAAGTGARPRTRRHECWQESGRNLRSGQFGPVWSRGSFRSPADHRTREWLQGARIGTQMGLDRPDQPARRTPTVLPVATPARVRRCLRSSAWARRLPHGGAAEIRLSIFRALSLSG